MKRGGPLRRTRSLRRTGPPQRKTPIVAKRTTERAYDRSGGGWDDRPDPLADDEPTYAARKWEAARRDRFRCVLGASPDCTGRYEQTHHLAGRGGPDPHRVDNLVSTCAPCHRWVHDHPAEAYANDWMRSRHTYRDRY